MAFIVTFMLAGILSTFGSVAQADLAKYIDQKRVVVLVADDTEDANLKQQKRLLAAAQSELDERDLIIIEETVSNGPYRREFKLGRGFSLALIGKDGGVKWRVSRLVQPIEIFERIDAMPMREQEIQRRNRDRSKESRP